MTPILRFSNPEDAIEILTPTSGWCMVAPYWLPKIAAYKGGGTFTNSAVVDGREFTFGRKDNVIENIPLALSGIDQDSAINTLRRLLKLFEKIEKYEDDTWLKVKPYSANSLPGYARIINASIPQIDNPFGQPFFSEFSKVAMEGINLIVEREPFWRVTEPNTILGPLSNYVKNSDFELWHSGIENATPDSWTASYLAGVTSERESESVGYSLQLNINSTTTGRSTLSQAFTTLKNNTTHTLVCRVRSEGIVGGYAELSLGTAATTQRVTPYQSNERHGYETFYGVFDTSVDETLNIYIAIVVESSPSSGTIYFDDLMLLEGDWRDELSKEILPFMSSCAIVNHSDIAGESVVESGDINYVDVWNLPGDVDSLVKLYVTNDTTPSDFNAPAEVFSKVRVGQFRPDNVQNYNFLHSPAGILDTEASNDMRIETGTLSTAWQTVTTKRIQQNVADNLGRFRVFARIYDTKSSGNPSIDARLKTFIGSASVGERTFRLTSNLVRGAWTLLDLTAIEAAVLTAKYSQEVPSQLGYTLQIRRNDTNTSQIYFDYLMIMPTQGGWLEATIDPPVTQGNALIVDNTGPRFSVKATYRTSGLQTLFRPSPVPQTFKEFRETLYIGCESGKLYTLKNGVGTEVSDYGDSTILALEVYNETLYIAHSSSVMTSDSLTYPGTNVITGLPNTVNALKSFNGLLYIGISGSNAPIYSWDNSSATLEHTSNETAITAFEVYANKLFAGTSSDATVIEYDPGTDTFSTSKTFTASEATAVTDLKAFKGKLYASTTPNGKVFQYAGDTWEEVVDFGIINTINALVVHDNKLYASGSPAAAIQVTEDGETWGRIYDESQQEVNAMISYEGLLILAENSQKNIITVPFSDASYKVPDHEGAPFASPVKDKHRWVFSVDRKDFVNAIDDQMLIGFGFVPRYLSLIGKGT